MEAPMSNLVPFLNNSAVFNPDAVRTMSIVFDDVCMALKLSATETKAREAIATKIIDLAQRGERRPIVLRYKVLRSVGVTEALNDAEQIPLVQKRYSGL
jgi:hypothetical protein